MRLTGAVPSPACRRQPRYPRRSQRTPESDQPVVIQLVGAARYCWCETTGRLLGTLSPSRTRQNGLLAGREVQVRNADTDLPNGSSANSPSSPARASDQFRLLDWTGKRPGPRVHVERRRHDLDADGLIPRAFSLGAVSDGIGEGADLSTLGFDIGRRVSERGLP